jgi:hypothetical protein
MFVVDELTPHTTGHSMSGETTTCERYYTVAEAARDFFQGKVSGRLITKLFQPVA